MTESELKKLERATFRAVADSGLWDLLLACAVAMLAIAPLLSPHLGDFWASAVFVPFWVGVWLVIRAVHARVVQPRVGRVEFSSWRKRRLGSLAIVMLVANLLALAGGVFAATRPTVGQTHIVPLTAALVLLIGFSTASFLLEIPRVFGYGLLMAAAFPLGEALFQRGYVSHHGFPAVFGTCAVAIFVSGIVRFVRFLPEPHPHPGGDP